MSAAFGPVPRYSSYWENALSQTMPPYAALALGAMRKAALAQLLEYLPLATEWQSIGIFECDQVR